MMMVHMSIARFVCTHTYMCCVHITSLCVKAQGKMETQIRSIHVQGFWRGGGCLVKTCTHLQTHTHSQFLLVTEVLAKSTCTSSQ